MLSINVSYHALVLVAVCLSCVRSVGKSMERMGPLLVPKRKAKK